MSWPSVSERTGGGARVAAPGGRESEPLVFFSYAANNPYKTIEVIWPDGACKSYSFTAGVPMITLTKRQWRRRAGIRWRRKARRRSRHPAA
jgi:hypothetical protein